MSKKDLLDRIATAPSDGSARRPEGVRPDEDAVQTRVSRQVVRRRPAPEPPPAPAPVAAAPRTVIRRRPEPIEPVAPPTPPAPAPTPVVIERAVAMPAIEVDLPPAPPAPTLPPAAAPAPAPVVEAAPAPAPVAVAPAPLPTPSPAPAPAPAPAMAAAPVDEPAPPRRDAGPRFPGLGSAVVAPPPGYDPTNPNTWRRNAGPGPSSADPGRRRFDDRTPAQPAPTDGVPGRRRPARAPAGGGRVAVDNPLRRTKGRRKMVGAKAASPAPKAQKRKVRIDNVVSVAQLAHEMGLKASVLLKELIGLGKMMTVNDMLDFETAEMIAAEFEYQVENVGFQEKDLLQHVADSAEEANLEGRPPVVTVMGHVDHGKTTLLDAIRKTRVAPGEAGGITQHIGAYQVQTPHGPVTFIDTPGHEAFSAMRARGAELTDIVVLVVAADDGVQPQTREAVSHAKAAEVPIVVALNKMDKYGVNPDNIKNQLSELGLVPEEWGGDTLYVPVSALKGDGVAELLDTLALQAEVLELTANPDRHAEGLVIEAKMQRGRGAVATVLVQKGTLKPGDFIVLGTTYGKVRALHDSDGKKMKSAGPSTPVELFGLSELPSTGDAFSVVATEKNAKNLAEHRAEQRRQEEQSRQRRKTAADLFAAAQGQTRETLNLVLKCDVQGSLEALRGALEAITVNGTEVRILHSGVGDISESDVNLIGSSNGMLIGFGVKIDPNAKRTADQLGVRPEFFDVIYSVIDRVTATLLGLLAPTYEMVRRGSAEIRAVFSITKLGKIAGSYVLDGSVGRGSPVKVLREGAVVHEGKVTSLKRFKEDVREVGTGFECGIGVDGFDDMQVGDVIEVYSLQEVAPTAGA
jgi:translation initiation factor IF-2